MVLVKVRCQEWTVQPNEPELGSLQISVSEKAGTFATKRQDKLPAVYIDGEYELPGAAKSDWEGHQTKRNEDNVCNNNVNQSMQMFDLITEHIAEKKRELECPVCLDVAKPPIYMCRDSHLICSICTPKVDRCPTCRAKYNRPILRNRTAEQNLEDIQKLQYERDKIRKI